MTTKTAPSTTSTSATRRVTEEPGDEFRKPRGQEGPGRRDRERRQPRLRLRLAFRRLGAELAVTYLNDKARPHVEPLAGELHEPHLPALRRSGTRPTGGRLRARPPGMGPARFPVPLDRLRTQGGPAQPGGRLLAGRLRPGHGRVVSLIHPDGQAGRAPHDGGRLPVDPDLLRVRESGRALQFDGAGESGPGERRPLHGRRTRPEGDQGPCPLARPGQDPGGLGD